ncbi:MAG: hypothetical protein U1F35_16105 [Steroidobacteraceae bacterium]
MTIFGAPIYVHSHVVIATALIGVVALKNVLLAFCALVSYLAIIAFHEIGHAAVARYLGYEVNAVRIALIHGNCEYEHPGSLWDAALVSWGGVGAQLILVVIVFSIAGGVSGIADFYFGPVVIFLGYINLAIALMNLIPNAPFDGHLAWRIFPAAIARMRSRSTVRRLIKKAAKRRQPGSGPK